MASVESGSDRAWGIAQRWQEYEGEARANLLRICAIGAFYLLLKKHQPRIRKHY